MAGVFTDNGKYKGNKTTISQTDHMATEGQEDLTQEEAR